MATCDHPNIIGTPTVGWGSGRQADMSASLGPMTTNPRRKAGKAAQPALVDTLPMTPEARRERAKKANAALTREQRSAAGKARAAALHSVSSYARRLAERWPTATDEEKRQARRYLREAGILR